MADVTSLEELCIVNNDVTDSQVLLHRMNNGELFIEDIKVMFGNTDGEEPTCYHPFLNEAFKYAIEKNEVGIATAIQEFFKKALQSKMNQAEEAMSNLRMEAVQ